MPPKSKPTEVAEPAGPLEALTASVKSMVASMEAMREQMATSNTTINNLSTRLAHIETILNATKAENTALKKELADSAQESSYWPQIPAEDECDANRVKIHLYEQFLRPILEGAVSKDILPTLPTVCEIIERARASGQGQGSQARDCPFLLSGYARAHLQAEEGVCPEGASRSRHQERQRSQPAS